MKNIEDVLSNLMRIENELCYFIDMLNHLSVYHSFEGEASVEQTLITIIKYLHSFHNDIQEALIRFDKVLNV